MDNIISADTVLHPDDIIDDTFIDDEIDTSWTLQLLPITSFNSAADVSPEHLNGDPYTPPLAKHITLRRINIHDITKHNVPEPPALSHDLTTVVRAQLDTGADITCTNLIDVLHDYRQYSISFPCKIRLIGAIGQDGDPNLGIFPLGEGYLHIPASTNTGYVCIR